MDRYPIRKRAVLVGIIAQVALIATALGIAPDLLDRAETIALSVVNILTLLGMVSVEKQTTPVSDPRDNYGRPLQVEKPFIIG